MTGYEYSRTWTLRFHKAEHTHNTITGLSYKFSQTRLANETHAAWYNIYLAALKLLGSFRKNLYEYKFEPLSV